MSYGDASLFRCEECGCLLYECRDSTKLECCGCSVEYDLDSRGCLAASRDAERDGGEEEERATHPGREEEDSEAPDHEELTRDLFDVYSQD